ncbi:hypothetical protein Plhal304r1_c003g0013681 [Plasmopara halstedii]
MTKAKPSSIFILLCTHTSFFEKIAHKFESATLGFIVTVKLFLGANQLTPTRH